MNKLLQGQEQKHTGNTNQPMENFVPLIEAESDTNDHSKKNSNPVESAVGMGSREIPAAVATAEDDELREAHRQLKTLLEDINEVLYSVDMASFKLVRISSVCEKVYGYTSEEFLVEGGLWQKLIYPGDQHIVDRQVDLLSQGKQVLNQYRIIHKDESIRWIENKIIPALNEHGTLVRIDGVTSDITERKRTEKELEESVSVLEATIESTADGILVANYDGKILRYNSKFLELSRIPREILDAGDDEKATGYVLAQLLNPEDFLSRMKELYVHREAESFDLLKFKDGRIIERYSKPQFIKDACVGRVWSFRDITQRIETEEALKESEARLRQIIDLVPHFIFAKDKNGKFLLVNEALAKAFGRIPENFVGKSDADFNTKKEEVDYFRQVDLQVINSGNIEYNIEETMTNSRGDTSILSTTKIPFVSHGVDTLGVLGISIDISERKKAETALKLNEERLSIATQIAKLGYWELDPLKNQFTFNDQFYSIYRTSAEKVGGYVMSAERFSSLFVHPDHVGVVQKEIEEAIKATDEIGRKIEHRIIYADGETGWVSVHYYIKKNNEGVTVKIYGVNQDITERKKAEEAIRKSEMDLEIKNMELEQKNVELEQFAYIASHDLQEPLRTTSSFINLLQKKYHGKFDEKADLYFNYVLEASERMKELIKNLLEYSRIGNKKKLEKVDCNEILSTVLSDLGIAISEANVDIECGRLPVINAFATELKQLFQNLITNAIKFRKKEIKPKIKISVQNIEHAWQFSFQDNGIGIPEKFNEKIFVIFQRLHNRTEYEGSGIGLSHCKKIVELHKGKIWVKSSPGEGSTFYFTIPFNNS